MKFSIACLVLVIAIQMVCVSSKEKPLENWTVEIVLNGKIVCGGVLVNKKYFITHGKCIDKKKLKSYFVNVGGQIRRKVDIVLEKREYGTSVIVGRLSKDVELGKSEIAKIPEIANGRLIDEAHRTRVHNYVTGIDKNGKPKVVKIDVLSNDECKGDPRAKFCYKRLSGKQNLCSLLPGSPIVSYIDSWTLIGFMPVQENCNGDKMKSLNIASYQRWIDYILKLKDGPLCSDESDCGKDMVCDKNVCNCPYCYKMINDKCEASNKSVLILGAGMAGIAAAKMLGDNGCDNVVIIEGSDRIGGRVKATNVSGYTMELGALWIYGLGTNPVAALANKYGLKITEGFETWTVRDGTGTDQTENAEKKLDELVEILGKVTKFASKMDENGSPDITTEALLRKFGWTPDTKLKQAMEVYELDTEHGKEMSAVSGKYLNYLRTFEDHGDDSWLIKSDPRGFSYVIEELRKELPANHTIEFNKVVTNIKDKEGLEKGVVVTTKDGSEFTADDVIVTFSLGVLQSRKVTFQPGLSKEKMLAIDKFGFGEYFISYFQFDTAFWDNTSALVYTPAGRGENTYWYNMNTVYPGCNILQLVLSGIPADAASRKTDEQIIEQGMDTLGLMYPVISLSKPLAFVRSTWLSDPLTMGSFSYWPTAFRPEDKVQLRKSEENIHFAGEHLSQTGSGFVHSALTSGRDSALRLAKSVRH